MTISFEEDRITTFVTQIDWWPGAREILLKTTDIVLKNLAQEYVKQIIESERMALSSRKRFGQNGLQLTEHVYYIKL